MRLRVLLSDPAEIRADAILRSVSAGLDADTPFSRELEMLAGREVSDRLEAMGDLPVGAAVITPGGDLPATFLIHVALQSPEDPVTPDVVRAALVNGLRRAEEWGLGTLALPPLGTGAGNIDAQEIAAEMVPVILDHLSRAESPKEVVIVVGSGYEEDIFARAIESGQRVVPAQES